MIFVTGYRSIGVPESRRRKHITLLEVLPRYTVTPLLRYPVTPLLRYSLLLLLAAPAAQAATINATSCSQADVQAAVSAAQSQDTVQVPACAATWNKTLTITKGIVLRGASALATKITGTIAPLITFAPSVPDSSDRFRISGFTLDAPAASNVGVVTLFQNTAIPVFVRIDHCQITAKGSRTIYVSGTFYGVVDNNVINGGSTSAYGNDHVQWDAFGASRAFGDGNNLYFEDNVYNTSTNGMMNSGGQGGRYASRYNTFNGNFGYVYDIHGNQPGGAGCIGSSTCGNASMMVIEIYGNKWNRTTPGYLNNLIDQRGGMVLVFMNSLLTTTTGKSGTSVREECADRLWPVNSNYVQHATESYYWGNWNTRSDGVVLIPLELGSENCCSDAASPWQPNHLYGSVGETSDIYCQKFTGDPYGNCWKKSQYTTPMVPPYRSGSIEPNWAGVAPRFTVRDGDINWLNMGAGSPIAENKDFFSQKAGSFDGTGTAGGGVGCGTLAARPATCTPGVGYWATDQSCSDMTGMVGVNPARPIAGTFYKCAAPDTWMAYYTPFTYPHPIRTDCVRYPTLCGPGPDYAARTSDPPPVRVYPNPWRSDRHAARSITFDQLTVDTEIKIFTVSGHHVKTLPRSSSSVSWDLTNESGDRVASGVYVYHLKADGGAKKTGKVVVIK